MTFGDYIRHYLALPYILMMLVAAMIAVGICLTTICVSARNMAKKYTPETQKLFIQDETISLVERFYELIFSATSILLFVGIYFLIDFFGLGVWSPWFWQQYNSLILLVLIMTSIMINTFIDRMMIPLRHMKKGERASMRLISMLYMLIVFAYIKFVDNNSNYDSIILYFLTLVIGRFVYFDTTVESVQSALSDAFVSLPLLGLALLCTAIMAACGFLSGYLLRSNGVVFSLFIAHLFLLAVIFLEQRFRIVRKRTKVEKKRKAQ
ncbi:MAG: hypothetical protein Q4B01_08100 [Eubacteriales bacterium]|nr:hypothetical protein [Eubacteriales bacterium]